MKNKIFSFFIFITFFILGSCKKSNLDLYPYNQVETTQAFKSQTDITLAVKGMYYGIRNSDAYYNGSWNIIADMVADNLIINQAGRLSGKTYGEWRYQPDNTYSLFNQGYTIVRRANAIIENITVFPDGDFKNNAIAEALAIRALTYFDMSRVYSKTYLNAVASDLTLPYVTTTDATIMPSKEPVTGFYEKVINDLNKSLTLINTDNGTGRFNKAAVAGLLSRVNLYKGDWNACITAANTALGSNPDLPGIANFPLIWSDQTEKGVLFKVINSAIDNINRQGVNYYQTVSGNIKSEYVVEYNLFQMFLPNDIRTSAYIKTSPYLGSNYNNVIKYAGGTGGRALGVCDAKVLRTAEVLLNRAEARYMVNDMGNALADLNLLKANRYTGFVDISLTGQPLLDEIYKERRLELAFEGDRFWDLKRRNLPVARDDTKGDKADGSGTNFVFTTMPLGDPRFLFPYPQNEITVNPNFKQNPGY
jgi:hypothetical protein